MTKQHIAHFISLQLRFKVLHVERLKDKLVPVLTYVTAVINSRSSPASPLSFSFFLSQDSLPVILLRNQDQWWLSG